MTRGKCTQIGQPSSPPSPSRSVRSMDSGPHFEFHPQLLFQSPVENYHSQSAIDVFGSMDIDQSPPQSPTPSPPSLTPQQTPSVPRPGTPPTQLATTASTPASPPLCSVARPQQWTRAAAHALETARLEVIQQQLQLQQPINEDEPMPGPQIPPDPDQIPPDPGPAALVNPLAEPAVSAEDKLLMSKVRDEWMKVTMGSCTGCHEQWFDLDVQQGKCKKCRHKKKETKYQDSNGMDPGPSPELPPLTQMEEMLISPVHALVSLYQVHGGQFKYSGHCCNFACDTAVFHNKDFRVQQNVIQQWLTYLVANHPAFRRNVTVDWDRVTQLPENALIHNQLHTVQSQNIPEPDKDVGPPQDRENPHEQTPLFTRGFVPNMNTGQTEIEQLQAAANTFPNGTPNGPVILTMPLQSMSTLDI
ncbi:hypothetical protein B0H10DRAFT_2250268 [Mycena sp. CBHHK59/15]|nr:hypothetical protein B0H10DRAFT_2250268 [Mycena sp. CBHHK59/15]